MAKSGRSMPKMHDENRKGNNGVLCYLKSRIYNVTYYLAEFHLMFICFFILFYFILNYLQ